MFPLLNALASLVPSVVSNHFNRYTFSASLVSSSSESQLVLIILSIVGDISSIVNTEAFIAGLNHLALACNAHCKKSNGRLNIRLMFSSSLLIGLPIIFWNASSYTKLSSASSFNVAHPNVVQNLLKSQAFQISISLSVVFNIPGSTFLAKINSATAGQ